MCDHASHSRSPIRLWRCKHGTFHLNVGHTTLHLSSYDLALMDHAISAWVRQNAAQTQRISPDPPVPGPLEPPSRN